MSLSDISKFFTEKSLDEIIVKAGGTKHTSYKFGGGFKKGDSYLSKVFRLSVYGANEVDGSRQEVNLIIKSMPENAERRRLFRSTDFFRNEINFYTKIIPAFEKFQQAQEPKNPFTEYPKCYLTFSNGSDDFIALEDVGILGYIAPNRQDYVTFEECLLTMRTLGRYHGIALAFADKDPKGFDIAASQIEETYYTENLKSWYLNFLHLAIRVAQDAVSTIYPGSTYEAITRKFLQEKLYDELISIVSAKSKYTVIGHGDCWIPNFLTKYSGNGSPEAIKIIDFQLARRSSLALDIAFFIYSCTSQKLREEHYDDLLMEYHASASAFILDLGGDPEKVLPYDGLLNELRNYGKFGCGMGIESLPGSMAEDEEVSDLDAIQKDTKLEDIWNVVPFKEEAKRQRMADIFKHAIDMGYIQ